MPRQKAWKLTNEDEANILGWKRIGKMQPREMHQGFLHEEQQTEAISGGSGMRGSEIWAQLGPAL